MTVDVARRPGRSGGRSLRLRKVEDLGAPVAPSSLRPKSGAVAPRSARRVVGRDVARSLCLLFAWLLLFGTVLSAAQEQRSQHVLFAQLRQQLAEATAPVQAPIPVGAPVALLSIARLGVRNLVVVEGSASTQLQQGPGHLPSTVLPGAVGVSVLLGRATTYGQPFRRIPELIAGDRITAVSGLGTTTYIVSGIRHAGDRLTPPPGGTGRLTLVTAQGSGWRSGWAPSTTVYVDAIARKPVIGGPVGVASAAMGPMAADSSTLISLVFWLQALLALGFVVSRFSVRWGYNRTWLVGGLLLVAVMWGATSAAWPLLPNLI